MQSIFRLPWCSEQYGAARLPDNIGLEKMRSTPVMEMPEPSKLKRKRSFGPSQVERHVPCKKQRPEGDFPVQASVNARMPGEADGAVASLAAFPKPAPGPVSMVTAISTAAPSSDTREISAARPTETPAILHELLQIPGLHSATPKTNIVPSDILDRPTSMTPLQQTIENEFNMQILMKHNELRLIEQELAKCQIALEQLRRCELQPFPGATQPSLAVSEGSGPALAPPPAFSRPANPAPYGVTDGPYSRHYRQWLLPDPQFDPISRPTFPHAETDSPVDSARSTRNQGQARKSVGKAAPMSTRRSESLQSIPNYSSGSGKDKSTALILRRSTDHRLVKLACNDCHRSNFNSIQGFLNHCRIAHKVDYKSHDMAAIDCGRLLDEAELAKLPPEIHAITAPKPSTSRSSTAHSTPIRGTFVHPFNAPAGMPMTAPHPRAHVASMPARAIMPSVGSMPKQPFTASAQHPRLSKLFTKYNVGGDLEQAVAAATQKVDLSHDDTMSPEVSEQSSPVAPVAGGGRTVGVAPRPSAADVSSTTGRSPSRKGWEGVQRHRPSPLTSTSSSAGEHAELEHSHTPSATFSPHTADSSPGLVSDHEDDDDHGSAFDEEDGSHEHPPVHHPLPVAARNCADDMQIDVEDADEMNQHGVIIRRNSMLAAEASGGNAMRKSGAAGKGGS